MKQQLKIEEEKIQEEQRNNNTRNILKKLMRDVKEIQANNARIKLYQTPQNKEYQNETTTRTELPWIKLQMRITINTHTRKRRNIVAGVAIIATTLIGIIVTKVQIDSVASQSGATEKDIKALRNMAISTRKLTIAIGDELKEQITENRVFDYTGQVTAIARNSLKRMTEIVESIISQKTDQATRQDQAGIIERLLKVNKAPIDPDKYQMMRTIAAQYQETTMKVIHAKGGDGKCKNTLRQATVITGSQKTDKHTKYAEEGKNKYRSLIPHYNDRTYITNPHNKMERTTQYNNKVVKIVPRLYEVYDKEGIDLHFKENPDPLQTTYESHSRKVRNHSKRE